MKKKIITYSAAETKKLGIALARSLKQGCVIALIGNLGAGKTVLTKGIAKGLKVNHVIQSPTFVLMKVYPLKHKTLSALVHVDCYRVSSPQELHTIGLEDYIQDSSAVVVIEWADKMRSALPKQRMTMTIVSRKEKGRVITIDDRRPGISKSSRRPHIIPGSRG